jgi:hypothetical protein
LTENKLKSLYFNYKEFKDKTKPWRECLLSIYWTSSFSTIRSGNLGMMYVNTTKAKLLEYSGMLEEMERMIHYLIYGQTYHSDNGLTRAEWSVHEFHELKASKVPTPYLVVGKRLLIINNSTADFGVSFEAMLKGLAYASMRTVIHHHKIESIEVYYVFARRMCFLDMKDWKKHKSFMEFLQKADRRVFDL